MVCWAYFNCFYVFQIEGTAHTCTGLGRNPKIDKPKWYMGLLYTMNALKSEPNDFKLITPSKYNVQKVVGSSIYE